MVDPMSPVQLGKPTPGSSKINGHGDLASHEGNARTIHTAQPTDIDMVDDQPIYDASNGLLEEPGRGRPLTKAARNVPMERSLSRSVSRSLSRSSSFESSRRIPAPANLPRPCSSESRTRSSDKAVSYRSRSSSRNRPRTRYPRSESLQKYSPEAFPRHTEMPPQLHLTGGPQLVIKNLTLNIRVEHLLDIFGFFGTVVHASIQRDADLSTAVVLFEDVDEVHKARKHMDGGQIDGQMIECLAVLPRSKQRPPSPHAEYPRSSTPPLQEGYYDEFGRYHPANRPRSPPPEHRRMNSDYSPVQGPRRPWNGIYQPPVRRRYRSPSPPVRNIHPPHQGARRRSRTTSRGRPRHRDYPQSRSRSRHSRNRNAPYSGSSTRDNWNRATHSSLAQRNSGEKWNLIRSPSPLYRVAGYSSRYRSRSPNPISPPPRKYYRNRSPSPMHIDHE